MITSKKLQYAYNNLYTELRNYIWDFDTVLDIAEVEEEIYKAFPDIKKLNKKLSSLQSNVRRFLDKAETNEMFSELNEILDEHDEIYANLDGFTEVIRNEHNRKEESNTDKKNRKGKLYHITKITKSNTDETEPEPDTDEQEAER